MFGAWLNVLCILHSSYNIHCTVQAQTFMIFLLLKVLYFVSGRPWIYMSSNISFSPHIHSDTMEPVVENIAYSSL